MPDADAKNVTLRPMTGDDLGYFSRWWRDRDLIALTSGDFARLSDAKVQRYFRSMLNDGRAHHFMIVSAGRTVGHVALAEPVGGWRELTTVIGEREGRNRGVGTSALRQVLAWAGRHGIARLRLAVRPDNLRAIRVYEKCGFCPGRLRHYPKKHRPSCRALDDLATPAFDA